jgi:NADH dehydrogenase/NADH:ubiquinone oxidoreductase subunit G
MVFLNKTLNACGISVLGVPSICVESLLTSQTIYLIGSDHSSDLVNSLISLDKLIVYSGTHNTFFLQSSDLVLPTLSLLETTGTFCNLEGSLQKSNIVIKSVTMARKTNLLIFFKTSIILKTAFSVIPSCFFTKICFNSVETNIKNYSLYSGFAKPFYYSYKNRFCKLPFIASIFDFHLIDTVTNSSKVMIKCSQTTRLSHKNFIL